MKRQITYLMCVSTMLLCSCSSDNNLVQKYMLEHSNIKEDSSYQEYEKIADQLNECGEYDVLPDVDDATPVFAMIREKPICVTINRNTKLNIKYYSDAKCEHEILAPISATGKSLNYLEHYLAPGESIYARIENLEGLYQFERFRIIDDIENHSESVGKWWSMDNSIYSITVPEDFTGTDIIIEPLGVYHYRILSLSDFIDLNGLKKYTDGKWTINDDECESGKASILPDVTYLVKYKYDENLYYTSEDDCIPTPYHIEEKKGTVEFFADNGNNTSYLVRLHPFTKINIVNDKSISSILRNNEALSTSEKNIAISKLKEGEIISIELNDPKFKVNGVADYKKTENGYEFTYTVPKATTSDNNVYSFNVEKWEKKKISISVKAQNPEPFNIFDTISGWFSSESADESAVVIEVSGVEKQMYLFKDIKHGKTIELNEPDVIKVRVNKNILSTGNITITANASENYEVNSQSVKTDFSFKYSDIDSLYIDINETI